MLANFNIVFKNCYEIIFFLLDIIKIWSIFILLCNNGKLKKAITKFEDMTELRYSFAKPCIDYYVKESIKLKPANLIHYDGDGQVRFFPVLINDLKT